MRLKAKDHIAGKEARQISSPSISASIIKGPTIIVSWPSVIPTGPTSIPIPSVPVDPSLQPISDPVPAVFAKCQILH